MKIIKIAKVFPGLVAVFLIARKILSYCNSSRKDCYNIKYQIDIDAGALFEYMRFTQATSKKRFDWVFLNCVKKIYVCNYEANTIEPIVLP